MTRHHTINVTLLPCEIQVMRLIKTAYSTLRQVIAVTRYLVEIHVLRAFVLQYFN